MPDDHGVGAHGLQGQRGVLAGDSPLATLEPLAEKLITSAHSHLAAASNEIRVRVESSKNRLTTVRPRRVGQLLDVAVRPGLRDSLGGVEDADRVVAAQVGGREQVPAPCIAACLRRARSSDLVARRRCSARPHLARSRLQRGGQVLADVVGADRQLAVAAVDEHRQLDGARAADVAQRVERGADRAAGEEHVVDEDHQRVVDAAGGDLGRAPSARGGLQAQVVAVHRDVEASRPGPSRPSNSSIRSASRRARATPRVGMPSRTRSGRPWCARGSRGRCGSARAGHRRRRGRSCRPRRGQASILTARSADMRCHPPSPPHRTGLKGALWVG